MIKTSSAHVLVYGKYICGTHMSTLLSIKTLQCSKMLNWYQLHSSVFGLSSSLPPLVGGGGGLVCESFGKADQLSDYFDGKQSRESVDLPLTSHPSPKLTSFAFRSSEVRHLLLDLDTYGSTN